MLPTDFRISGRVATGELNHKIARALGDRHCTGEFATDLVMCSPRLR